jgi:DNA-binding response OmpR family regulator
MSTRLPRLPGMTPNDRNPRALLLTEDREALQSLSAAFQRRGFEVLTASDGARGLEVLLDTLLSLDVLVTDLDLPGRDGASLLRLVRVAGGEHELAIVIRCAGLSSRDRGVLRALGADAVVSPADGADAIAALADEAIDTRAAGDARRSVTLPRRQATPHPANPVRPTFGSWPLALPAAAA